MVLEHLFDESIPRVSAELDALTGPWDSPLEEELAHTIAKYIPDDALFMKQFPVSTICGDFRLDFVVEVGGHRVGFECDGKDFHDSLGFHDQMRDALIIDTGKISSVFRFRGTDVHWEPEVCLYIASRLEPKVFSSSGRVNLETLVARRIAEPDDWEYHSIRAYLKQPETGEEDVDVGSPGQRRYDVVVERHTANPKGLCYGPEQHSFVRFAKERGRAPLDTRIDEWRNFYFQTSDDSF